MKGQILDFNFQKGEGIISGDDGKRYTFTNASWQDTEAMPQQGMRVDFEVEDENKAINIYRDVTSTSSTHTTFATAGIQSGEKNKIVAGLLGIFLGGLGLHKFYLGCKQEGLIMLVVWFVGWFIGGFPSLVVALIGFIEGIIYLFKSDEEFYDTYVANQKCWF